MADNFFYVYALKDPTTSPAKPFYTGKGTGSLPGLIQKELPTQIQQVFLVSEAITGESKRIICITAFLAYYFVKEKLSVKQLAISTKQKLRDECQRWNMTCYCTNPTDYIYTVLGPVEPERLTQQFAFATTSL